MQDQRYLDIILPPDYHQPVAISGIASEEADPNRPLVVFIHGVFRHGGMLASWPFRLKHLAQVLIVDLPGHGHSLSTIQPSIDNMTQAIGRALSSIAAGRRVILVGESLGGLIVLGLQEECPRCDIRSVIALDPPMSTAKLWSVHTNLAQLPKHKNPSSFDYQLIYQLFGLNFEDKSRVDERIYYPILDKLTCPTFILTGDVPLFPPRPGNFSPCLFDAVDQYILRRFYPAMRCEVLSGAGHLLLGDRPDACQKIFEGIIAEHAG